MTAPPFGEEQGEVAQDGQAAASSGGHGETKSDTAFLTEALTTERPRTDGTDATMLPGTGLDGTNLGAATVGPLDLTDLPGPEGEEVAALDATEAPLVKKDSPSTTRQKGLLKDAQTSDGYLEVARDTMLDLAKALEDAAKRKRRLEDMIEEEKMVSAQLRLDKIPLQKAIEEGLEREAQMEQKRMNELMQRDERRGDVLWYAGTWWAQHALAPLGIMHPDAPTSGARGQETLGDRWAVKEFIHLWKSACAIKDEVVIQEREIIDTDAIWEAKIRELEAAWAKKLQAEKEKTAQVRAELEALRPEIAKLEAALQSSRAEVTKWQRKVEEVQEEHRKEVEKFMQQIEEVKLIVVQREVTISEQQKVISDWEDKYKEMQAKHEAELAALREQIRRLTTQMDEQVVTLKTTREVVKMSKRETSGGISPERFAQLVSELEELRDKLALLGRDNDYDRERSQWLTAKLEQNRRRLELERQFLPLLHKVRGPVGPKNPMLKSKNAADQFGITLGPAPVPPDQRRISHSQSASSIDAPRRAATAAGRMASSAGFSKGFSPPG